MASASHIGPQARRKDLTRWTLTAFVSAVILANVALLVFGVVTNADDLSRVGWRVLAWLAAEAAIGLATLSFESGSQLGLDAPLLLAAGFVFGPFVAGLIASFGYIDLREFRRESDIRKALFNRSQISLSVMAAALAFDTLGVRVGEWPAALFAAAVAVGVDILANWGMVAVVRVLHEGVSVQEGLRGLFFGNQTQFLVTYAAFSLVGAALADVYQRSGLWSLLMFALPIAVARQAFFATDSLDEASEQLRLRQVALMNVAKRVADERRDERLMIAAGIHDEIVPPLFRVHLMGQVCRNDLASGQLLALETDVPELVDATNEANAAMRRLIGGLRASPLGATGLVGTLRLLCDELSANTSARIVPELRPIDAPPLVQLLTYQVAREALRNSVRHANANRIDLKIDQDDEYVRLVVADDGVGFAPGLVDTTDHFGLQLIRERVELIGGTLVIDTALSRGTAVVAKLPADLPAND